MDINSNKFIIVSSIAFVLILSSFFILNVENSNEFDICEDQPLFGLKYENCDSIECINFHENIKEELKVEQCGVNN